MKTLLAALALAATLPAGAADVVRHRIPNSDFPIAQAVEVPSGQTLVFVSGAGPDIADPNADKASPAAYGDTKAQTLNTLKKIETTLKSLGLGMKDVVKMQVFLVGDPARGGKMDFAGLMESYKQFFGTTEQPNLPARSAMQVAALANPGWLVEIEVTAARGEKKSP
jgi:enamine deaminase RidA (YjgF/YER057c/UK114 family)